MANSIIDAQRDFNDWIFSEFMRLPLGVFKHYYVYPTLPHECYYNSFGCSCKLISDEDNKS